MSSSQDLFSGKENEIVIIISSKRHHIVFFTFMKNNNNKIIVVLISLRIFFQKENEIYLFILKKLDDYPSGGTVAEGSGLLS